MRVTQLALLSGLLCLASASPVAQVERDDLDRAEADGSDATLEPLAGVADGLMSFRRTDTTLCNPRVRVCENPLEAPDRRRDESRARTLDTVLCNPRVRICSY